MIPFWFKMKNKKAQALSSLQELVLPLVGVCIILAIGFLIISEAKDQVASTDGVFAGNCTATTGGGTANYTSVACNASEDVQNAMAVIPGWLPIIVITVIGAVLIGLVMRFRSIS